MQKGTVYTLCGRPRRLTWYFQSFQPRSMIAFGKRSAVNTVVQGCLIYDAMILTNKGYIPIGDLYTYKDRYKDTKVWTGDSWTRYIPCYMGKATKYRITLSNGQIFYCDNRHKIKIYSCDKIEWRCITDYDKNFKVLKVGDKVCLNKAQQVAIDKQYTNLSIEGKYDSNPQRLELNRDDILDLCYLYGAILGDGHIRLNHCKEIHITYGYTKFNNISKITNFLERNNIRYSLVEKDRTNENRKPIKNLNIYSVTLVSAMQKLFDYNSEQYCKQKRLSNKIFTFDLEMVLYIFKGLYDTDMNKSDASLHMGNEDLLRDIQKIAYYAGFKSNLFKTSTGYKLCFRNKSYLINWIKSNNYSEPGSNKSITDYHREVLKNIDKPKKLSNSDRVIYYRVLKGGSTTLTTFRRFIDTYVEDYDYEEVVSIENLNETVDTYELTVEDARQQFICDDIVNHNTGADVLKMAFMNLYKMFYSNPDTRNSNRKYVKFLNTVHDEINFGVNKDNARKLIPMIVSCMRLWFPEWKFPMKVGLDIGNRWGQTVGFTYNEISHIPITEEDKLNPNLVRYRQLTPEEQDKYQMYGPASYVKDQNGEYKNNPDYLKVEEPNGEELTEADYAVKEEKKEEVKIEEPVSEIVEEKLFDNLMEEI